MEFYKILQEIMAEKDLTVSETARICNLPDGTIRSILVRQSKYVSLEVAFKISSGLQVSLERLNGEPEKKDVPHISPDAMRLAQDYDRLDWHGQRIVRLVADEEKDRCTEQAHTDVQEAPDNVVYITNWFPMPMSAGTGQPAGDDEPEELELSKRPPRGTTYIAPISGNSMEPTFHDGDRLFIRATMDIKPGQIGVFYMDGQQWVKELGDGVLVSHNPDYAPIPMRDDIQCEGLVLGVCDDSYFK